MIKFARKLRKGQVAKSMVRKTDRPAKDLVLLLENVYDTFNVGGMYRVGDACGVSTIFHCEATPMPPNIKISRAAVGLDQYIKHEKVGNILTKIQELKKLGYTIVVLEQNKNARIYDTVKYEGKIALVVGNETFGVSEAVIKQADLIVELPMYGINKSLNVVVATGIVLYQIRKSV